MRQQALDIGDDHRGIGKRRTTPLLADRYRGHRQRDNRNDH
jgi:hypothetical protein